MNNYDPRQLTREGRKNNCIKAFKILSIDNREGIEFRLPFDDKTDFIMPSDFQIRQYKVGEYVDLIIDERKQYGRTTSYSVQRVGMSPPSFIPEDRGEIGR